jgi:hypothetical protein
LPYDRILADRIRKSLSTHEGVSEKQMFGGIGFLVNGNMCCGVHRRELMVRLDPKATEVALGRAHTREFDVTGRPMRGWILVANEGLATEEDVAYWVSCGFDFAKTLPSKRDA